MINPELININNNKKSHTKTITNTSYTILNVISSSSQEQNTVSWLKKEKERKKNFLYIVILLRTKGKTADKTSSENNKK